jgi:aspartyl-tRNA(Asn)/glutamyl-tRNA(Gln) amidotransferase subunit A
MAKFPESLSSIQLALASKRFSLNELVLHYIEQINANKELNAFNHLFETSALGQAAHIQEKISSGNAGKLAGLVTTPLLLLQKS